MFESFLRKFKFTLIFIITIPRAAAKLNDIRILKAAAEVFRVLKLSLKTKKYWTHHERKYVYDVSKFCLFDFVGAIHESPAGRS